MLNRQLTQPPSSDRKFEAGIWPVPGTLNWAPDIFDRILERGTDPDSETFLEPNEENRYFNLFTRVAEHLPTSSDWLFKPLAPYFNSEPPSVDYAGMLIENCLRRLHMRRLGAEATEFAHRYHPGRTTEVGRQVLSALSANPDPIHLILLCALYHERQWHQPDSKESDELGKAFIRAYKRFVQRDEFTATLVARKACGGIGAFFYELERIVLLYGHRSRRPSNGNWCPMWHPNLIIGHEFEHAEALDLYVSMGVAVPFWAFLHPHLPPSKRDGVAALDRLCDEAATTVEQWATYEPEHPDVHRKARHRFRKKRQRSMESESTDTAPRISPDVTLHDALLPPFGIDPNRLNLSDLNAV